MNTLETPPPTHSIYLSLMRPLCSILPCQLLLKLEMVSSQLISMDFLTPKFQLRSSVSMLLLIPRDMSTLIASKCGSMRALSTRSISECKTRSSLSSATTRLSPRLSPMPFLRSSSTVDRMLKSLLSSSMILKMRLLFLSVQLQTKELSSHPRVTSTSWLMALKVSKQPSSNLTSPET